MISVGVVAGLGLLLGLALALADKYISVPEDERVSKVQALLPGANCGSCGRAGCAAMAKALCSGEAVLTECPVMNGESRERWLSFWEHKAEKANRRRRLRRAAEVYAAPILHSMRDCTIADRPPPDLRDALTGAWE
ncbi:MAG: hypothetical protein L6V89_02660 [Oscillospiraceae bacterium]|nr:MAG: hypothetical protein L6V89_02660 [Oscillospiraceae bacterium]